METMMKIKTALKLAPSTCDEDYNRRKREMKDLCSAIRSYNTAMEKAKVSVRRLVEALTEASKVFETLCNYPNIPDCTKDCALALVASMNRIEGTAFPEFNVAMDSTVLTATNGLKALYDECERLECKRNKVMHEYDTYREEVSKKETEYLRKSKSLLKSKYYSTEVARRDELEAAFDSADQKFKDTHDQLMQSRSVTCTDALNAFVSCMSRFMEEISGELEGLKGSSEYVLPVLRNIMRAEHESD
ncbi:conserved hypothetical protein [Leishmania infantum JPCM5]|uniref:BAR_domain_containing_protein_-_putative n=2 Tax=Leishmania infantum TaxID=5671 RepID=A0A6L0XC41_LEIIN|nr:conserved hypothetical protein [Leishmania infantum JPCM5]CAC9485305.1 BAR_domain_containing_protein_-_putative [Leishmania infantum]CAM67928.1 conserved hypothetical protein [Leishmania infantum JPCM5]SUZ41464.1 BAR_domain_containing_protein_-_putative [Leishmania infantum]|eukprot:XP_001465506.1 conserved hypothetical protein [Leishmania infantum JPCM5]